MTGTATCPPAATDPIRRVNIGDGLILISALGLTLALLRSTYWFHRFLPRVGFWWRASGSLMGVSPWPAPALSWWDLANLVAVQIIAEFGQLLTCLLVGLTLAQPLLRMRPPRPPLWEVVRQSGFVVSVAVVLATFLLVDLHWCFAISMPPLLMMGASLLLLWPIAALAPWRTDSSWVDRLGRAVGIGWIIVAASGTALHYL